MINTGRLKNIIHTNYRELSVSHVDVFLDNWERWMNFIRDGNIRHTKSIKIRTRRRQRVDRGRALLRYAHSLKR